jgi:hypothetical protein
MTQTMYAHVNKWTKKSKKTFNHSKTLENVSLWGTGQNPKISLQLVT